MNPAVGALIGAAVPVILGLIYASRRFGALEARVKTLEDLPDRIISLQTAMASELRDCTKSINESIGLLRDKIEESRVDTANRLGRLEGAAWGIPRPVEPSPGHEASG